MPIDIASVKLDIKNQSIRQQLEAILSSMDGFRIRERQAPGFCDLHIVEVSEDLKLGEDAKEELQHLNSHFPPEVAGEIILTSSRADQTFLLQVMRAGVKEFLPQPLNEDEARAALLRYKVRKRAADLGKKRDGEIIDILAVKGGVGATTIAVNLATCLIEQDGVGSVALVDMHPQCGEIPLFLDIDHTHHWGEVVKNIANLNPTYLMSILSKHSSGVYVLPSPPRLEEMGELNPAAMSKIMEMLKDMFEYVVIDSGQSINYEVTRKVLDMADRVFLVMVMNLPSLTIARRNIEAFDRLDYPMDKVKIIINRYLKTPEISLKDVENALGLKPFWLIPNDYNACMSSLNQGRSISSMNPGSLISKAFKSLAATLTETPEKEEGHTGGSWWKKLIGSKKA